MRRDACKIISDASELGVLGFLMAGGEPFLFPGLLELCEEFNDRLFVIATNGTILKETDFERLKNASNVAIIVGIDGGKDFTNLRRGQGTYEKATGTIKRLSEMGVLTGISVTITSLNYRYWMESKNLERLISKGVLLAAFLEYIPNTYNLEGVQDSWEGHPEEGLMLTKEERAEFHS
jgi:MoaA/NifB/PqqE/SkfB family radical SAM enzyme